MLASLAYNTTKQYNPCLKKWYLYCETNNYNFYSASANNVLNFLVFLYKNGNKYGTINSTKAALSLILGSNITNDSRITRFMKGVFKLRTPLPKYNVTWGSNDSFKLSQ